MYNFVRAPPVADFFVGNVLKLIMNKGIVDLETLLSDISISDRPII